MTQNAIRNTNSCLFLADSLWLLRFFENLPTLCVAGMKVLRRLLSSLDGQARYQTEPLLRGEASHNETKVSGSTPSNGQVRPAMQSSPSNLKLGRPFQDRLPLSLTTRSTAMQSKHAYATPPHIRGGVKVRWPNQPALASWVTPPPSLRHPHLVRTYA